MSTAEKTIEQQVEPKKSKKELKETKKQANKIFVKGMSRLLRYMRRYWPALIVAIVLTIASAVFVVLAPTFIRRMTDQIWGGFFIGGIDMAEIASLGAVLIIVYVLSAVLNYAQTLIMAWVNNRLAMDLRGRISKKINTVPLKYYDKNTVGDVLSRTTNDVDKIGEALNWGFTPLINNVAVAIGTLIAMFIRNWILAFTALGTIPIALVMVGLVVAFSQKFFKRRADLMGDLNGIVEENYSGQSVVKAFNGQKKACKEFGKVNKKHFKASLGAQFFQGIMFPAIAFVSSFGFIAVCVVGAMLHGRAPDVVTVGVIVAFTMYVGQFQRAIGQVGESLASLQAAAAGSVRVFDLLEEEEQVDESGKESYKLSVISGQNEEDSQLLIVKGRVEFRNVKFGYDPEKTIIHDFSAVVEPGQKVAIVGPTGAGKTTMVNLLMRFYEIDGGQILIDGVDISGMRREDVRAMFGMVLQDSWLFEGSIRDNIIYSMKDVSQRQVTDAAKAAGIDHFIRTLPEGYNMVLDDEVSISGGQRQLLTIARAMIQNSPMLILDEATSNVDTRTEQLIQDAMDKITKGRTSFVIAHRLSTIKNADLILVMKDGDIVEKGNHVELLGKGGFYSELYNSQFSM